MAKWTAFPHAGDYAFDATSLKPHRIIAMDHGQITDDLPADALFTREPKSPLLRQWVARLKSLHG